MKSSPYCSKIGMDLAAAPVCLSKIGEEDLKKINAVIWLIASIFSALGGLAAFVFLFVLDFNVYWLILSPLIIAIYESPAAYFFWLYKKAKLADEKSDDQSAPDGI